MEEDLSYGEIALHVGCGNKHWEGWIGIDHTPPADCISDLKSLPYEDNYASRVAAIHVLEHFYPWETHALLREWKRVLQPGGILIVELPCMDKVFRYITACLHSGKSINSTFSWLPIWGDPQYHREDMMHRWGYFVSDVLRLFEDQGFQAIASETPRYHYPMRDMRITGRKI